MTGVAGRRIVVTGAGGGLGREYAKLLAREGAKVVINDLGGARDGSGGGSAMADAVVKEIQDEGGEAVANYDSVATEDGGKAIVQTCIDAFGGIDGVVSNAGILRDVSYGKMDAAAWDAVQQVHLYGGYYVTHAAWPHFREQKYGRIVVATSTSGIYGNFGQANYGAAKLGLVGLINTLAIEGAKYNINANAMAPIAATRMTEDLMSEERLQSLAPEHVAPVVGYLMSDESTDTGSVFVAGGGLVQRVAYFASAGHTFDHVATLADVADNWSKIVDMSSAKEGKQVQTSQS
ncbi:SDR family oxidoreductase [Cumulibacter manganitolerans]|uniref:SDR family oxidoreductase n=1 Tax=Cumulibacter manganitolerans TaxID=1884992 RepID=UPI001295C13D|nr:SDR family oxidoreductase [Cumulibacter manganitolerans]